MPAPLMPPPTTIRSHSCPASAGRRRHQRCRHPPRGRAARLALPAAGAAGLRLGHLEPLVED
ncbi:hypothetical protein CVT20_34780, partial [Pseudomonas aeruginosa]